MDSSLFTVLPMSQRFSLTAGDTYHGSIIVANPVKSTKDFHFTVTATPYGVIGENYTADLTTMNVYSEIANWITIENPTGSLAPNESQEVHFTINVPENAHAGGQYATLLVSQDPTTTENKDEVMINNLLQLASVLYADVSGETIRDGEILENNIPSFAFGGPVSISSLITNRGNVHTDAIFDIKVTNNLTGEVIFPRSTEDGEEGNGHFSEIIMPESTRYIVRELDNLPVLGSVKISQSVYFNDIPSINERDLLICPPWFILLVLFSITAIILFIIFRVRAHRRHKFQHLT